LPRLKVLHGLPGTPPGKQTLPMQWLSADVLEAAVPISGRETVLNTVEIPGQPAVVLSPVCLPYSPEFAPDQPGRGGATLAQLAAATGGKERIELSQTWAELPVKPRFIEMAPWLLVLAVTLFLLEIFERRTGWLSRWFAGRAPSAEAGPAEERASAETFAPQRRFRFWKRASRLPGRAVAAKSSAAASPSAELPASSATPAPGRKPAEAESNLDALRRARERASRRTHRES